MTSVDCLSQGLCFVFRAEVEPLCLGDGAGGMHREGHGGRGDRRQSNRTEAICCLSRKIKGSTVTMQSAEASWHHRQA